MTAAALVAGQNSVRNLSRRWVIAGIASLAVVVAVCTVARTDAPSRAIPATAPASQSGWAAVPLSAQLAISRAIGADQPSYRVQGGVVRDPSQKLSFRFSAWGVVASAAGGTAALGLRGRPTTPIVRGNEVFFHRGAVSEWYANGPLGLEQGFTLSRNAPSVLPLSRAGSLRPRVIRSGAGLLLVNARGHAVLREVGLSASDAHGRALRARFVQGVDGRVSIAVQLAGATFPVTVDPVIQQAQLTATDEYANEGSGATVAGNGTSAGGVGSTVAIDGQTIAVGAPGASVTYGAGQSTTNPNGISNSYQGAVYVFTEPSNGWADATQTAKLVASDGQGAAGPTHTGQNVYGDSLGSSLAISGNTIVAGAPRTDAGGQDYAGKIYVFTEPAGGWGNSFQTAELAAHNATVDDFLGEAVAFDGQTVVAAVPNRTSNSITSSVYVFAKPSSGGWVSTSQQSLQIPDPSNSLSDQFGQSLAVSGSTIAVGAPNTTDGGAADGGAVYTFTDPGTGWTSPPTEAKLTPTSPVANEAMGYSVAIAGNTVIAGAPHGGASGAAYVFTNGASWSAATQARLTATDAATGDDFGRYVYVAGSSALVAGYSGSSQSIYQFTEPFGGWVTTNQATESVLSIGGSSTSPPAAQGTTVVVGDPSANDGSISRSGVAHVLSTNGTPGGGSGTTTTTTTTTTTAATTTTTATTPTTFTAPPNSTLTYTAQPVYTDTTTAADVIAGLFGLTPGSGETENLGEFTFVAYCNKPQGQCAASTSFGQQLGTGSAARAGIAKAKKKPKPIVYGKGKISIKAGKHAKVTVKLTALGRRLLKKSHVLRGTLRVSIGATSKSHKFTLRYKPKTKKRKR
jgi:FG-GAP repeat